MFVLFQLNLLPFISFHKVLQKSVCFQTIKTGFKVILTLF